MSRLVSWVLSRAWRRGVLGGNQGWLAAGGVALVVWALQRALTRGEESVVFREKLEPGQRLVIDHPAGV